MFLLSPKLSWCPEPTPTLYQNHSSPKKSHQEQASTLSWILFQSGYNQIFIIPAGATSIRIEEAAASRNFLGERWFGAGQPRAQRGNLLSHIP